MKYSSPRRRIPGTSYVVFTSAMLWFSPRRASAMMYIVRNWENVWRLDSESTVPIGGSAVGDAGVHASARQSVAQIHHTYFQDDVDTPVSSVGGKEFGCFVSDRVTD
eukprot:1184385-Prorocentrum_minimum.AAC.4